MIKRLIIIGVAMFGVMLAVPTMFPKTAPWFPGFIQPISLGLDLQGGAQLLLEVDTDALVRDAVVQLHDTTRSSLLDRTRGMIRFSDLRRSDYGVTVVIRESADVSRALARLRSEFGASVDVSASGNVITLSYSDRQRAQMIEGALERSIEIVRRRIDALGTRDPAINTQGGRRILVQLPGVDDPERIKELIGQTARMSFHLVNESITHEQMAMGRPPSGTYFLPMIDNPYQLVAVFSRIEVSGESLTDAQSSFDQHGMPVVTQVFDSVGARRFARLTTENVGVRFAIVLDGMVLSAPVIREPIPGGRGQISGNFTVQSANDLAVLLRSGALPAPLSIVEERTVGASLGADTIRAGAIGTVIGVLFLMFAMILIYGKFGMIANIALIVNMMMIVGVSAFMGATLTLPGIAGIALTLAMAVDANVLQFERLREELRTGASALRSIDVGFDRAMKTVIDANLTTLIAALVLFQFGAGPIRGFAVTLSVGIITTLFTCILLSRVMIDMYMGGQNRKIGYVKS
ncbi:MAG: protein translocase subunit SecD [Alphaproteobacteria bacterium]|nr:protein translocase subunit SecD [Alphaproteobacteria bacterium]